MITPLIFLRRRIFFSNLISRSWMLYCIVVCGVIRDILPIISNIWMQESFYICYSTTILVAITSFIDNSSRFIQVTMMNVQVTSLIILSLSKNQACVSLNCSTISFDVICSIFSSFVCDVNYFATNNLFIVHVWNTYVTIQLVVLWFDTVVMLSIGITAWCNGL